MRTDSYRTVVRDNWIYPLGIYRGESGLHISVVEKSEACRFVIYEKGKDIPFLKIDFPAEGRMGDVWSMTVVDDGSGAINRMLKKPDKMEYCFEANGKEFSDPYGRAFTGHEDWGNPETAMKVQRSLLPGAEPVFDWQGDKKPMLPYEKMIMYRLHPRGFTKHPSARVRDRGTFKAVTEKIPYMKELGITTVELLPPMEFNEVVFKKNLEQRKSEVLEPSGKLNYWGYAEAYCFAPKASYCAGREKHPVTEFKTLVRELHKNNLEIVVEIYFTGGEDPSMVRDAVRFWVKEYHVDGVHLVGFLPVNELSRDPYLSGTKLFATSWDGCQAGEKRCLCEYNDGFMIDMRRLLKGDEDQMNNLIYRSKRNPKEIGVVNYMANTNGFTMMDMVSYDMKHNEANGEKNEDGADYNYSWNCGLEGPTRKKKIVELRKKQLRNSILILMLSQGTPLLLAGDEFGQTKKGNNNSYCQDNEISWLNWNLLKTNQDLYEFVKKAIDFRKKHPVFHQEQEPKVMDYLACGHPDVSYHGVKAWCPEFENFRRQLGIMYCGAYGKKKDGTTDDYFFVAYNMHWEPHEFALPNLPKKFKWHLAFNTDENDFNGIYEEGKEPLLERQKQFVVPPRSIVVFIGKEPG